MSGDNSYLDYNEPGAMREYALSLGVPEGAVVLDYAGRRTYDTCYRARAIFGIGEGDIDHAKFSPDKGTLYLQPVGIEGSGCSLRPA